MNDSSIEQAFSLLAEIYDEVDRRLPEKLTCRACGECCHFESYGHRLFSTHLEALYLRHVSGNPPVDFTDDSCGYQKGALCLAIKGRVLGCRTFFCDAGGDETNALHECALEQIRRICREFDLPWRYSPLAAHFGLEAD